MLGVRIREVENSSPFRSTVSRKITAKFGGDFSFDHDNTTGGETILDHFTKHGRRAFSTRRACFLCVFGYRVEFGGGVIGESARGFDLNFTFLVFLISHGNPKMITVPRKSKTQTVV